MIDLKGIKKATVTDIDWRAFEDSYMLEEIIIPESVKEIGMSAFELCLQLKSVIISGMVQVINPYTFSQCESLESVTVPESVRYISDNAFRGCTALKDIYVDWNVAGAIASVEYSSFMNVDVTSVRLHVPEGKGSIYEKDEFWSQFIIIDPLVEAKAEALKALDQAKAGCVSDEAKAVLDSAVSQINNAESAARVNEAKQNALIDAAKADNDLIAAPKADKSTE